MRSRDFLPQSHTRYFSAAHTHARASFSTMDYFLSASNRLREAKATVSSSPGSLTCVRMAQSSEGSIFSMIPCSSCSFSSFVTASHTESGKRQSYCCTGFTSGRICTLCTKFLACPIFFSTLRTWDEGSGSGWEIIA